ncbi:hypothetical protein QR680_009048 [Steinernema hermaphroditum]|uniref:Uncharacterized protein n=1 Tax=Steinernema hermaphroditum TaxID=289476 RepID=A0AA39IK65_9BILA|nr:hypothetical protein QR680_009048 [Steinernema hermaphroditum]
MYICLFALLRYLLPWRLMHSLSHGDGRVPRVVKRLLLKIKPISALAVIATVIFIHQATTNSDFCSLPMKISENAFLAGYVAETFDDTSSLKNHQRELYARRNGNLYSYIAGELKKSGIDVYKQEYRTSLKQYEQFSGKTVYGIVPSFRSPSVESMIVAVKVDSDAYESVAVALALASYCREQVYWARNIIFLFVDNEIAMEAWLSAYHGMQHPYIEFKSIEKHAGFIIGGVVIDFRGFSKQGHLNIQFNMMNGRLPNLDLLNVVQRLSQKHDLILTVYNRTSAFDLFETAVIGVLSQAFDELQGIHSVFGDYGIQVLGIETRGPRNNDNQLYNLLTLTRLNEGVLRALNNVLEKLHQSYFMYVLLGPDRFLSIAYFMIPIATMFVPLLLLAIQSWLQLKTFSIPSVFLIAHMVGFGLAVGAAPLFSRTYSSEILLYIAVVLLPPLALIFKSTDDEIRTLRFVLYLEGALVGSSLSLLNFGMGFIISAGIALSNLMVTYVTRKPFSLLKSAAVLCSVAAMFRAAICCLLLLSTGTLAAIGSVPSCDAESTPVFLLQHNSTSGSTLRTVHVPHLGECSEHCSKASDCVGVDFAGQECRVLGASDSAFAASDESMTLTKTCVKSERVCSSAFHFDAYEQKILVGFAREVVSADSIEVCLAACLNAFDTHGFECESVMYYPVDRECILNTEDRLDRPDLFIDEHQDQVIYLDNNCAGSQCYAPYVTQYIAVEGRKLNDVVGIDLDVDLESCESMCTQRLSFGRSDFNCKAFVYDNSTNKCTLLDERSKPLGRADLTEASETTYFEKKCFASPRTCRNVPSFTRVPQMILVGFAAFVMENVPSVTMCLDQCTNPPPETGENFQCKSVMYYYNEQECILNAETRFSKPDLFIPEGTDFLVDYFDITCHLDKEMCPKGTELRSVRTLNAELPEGEGNLHVIEGSGENVGQCLAKCFVSAPEKCRSFNFDKKTSRCNLLYLDGKTTVRPQAKTGVDLYDLHCLAVPSDCSLNQDGALYSRYLHTKQAGLPLEELKLVSLNTCLDTCATKERCEGVNYNRRSGVCSLFEQIDENSEPNEHVDFYKNLCVVKEVDTGASSAANVPVDQAQKKKDSGAEERHPSVGGSKVVKPVVKAKADTRHHPQSSKSEEYKGGEGAVEASSAAPEPERVEPKPVEPTGGSVSGASLSVVDQGAPAAPVLVEKSAVQTICNYEGIKVQVKNPEAFTGVMFVKNKYDSCRVEVSNSDSATLVLGLPANFGMKPIVLGGAAPEAAEVQKPEKPAEELRRRRETERDCGLQDMDNGVYKSTVVIQTNNLGIPGLVTSMDQIYEVACDYSSMLGGKITVDGNVTVTGPEASLIQPRGKIELGNPVLMQMNSGSGEHAPVLQAKLGDILELRWEIMAMDEELDFFVKDCFAEPGASGRDDERLQLIEAGCPTPAVAQKLIPGPIEVQSSAVKVAHLQAFRFDSSSTVRVTCHLEICKGECQAATCEHLQSEQKTSWGRKKREDNFVTQYETKRYKVPRFAQATTSLVIVEPLQAVAEPVALSRASTLDLLQEHPLTEVVAERTGLMCMQKLTIGVVFGLLFVVTVIQLLVVAQYVFQRLFRAKKTFPY